jgi:hypothetical protein
MVDGPKMVGDLWEEVCNIQPSTEEDTHAGEQLVSIRLMGDTVIRRAVHCAFCFITVS